MTSKSRLITVRVSPKQADEILRQDPRTPIGRQFVKEIRAEFLGLVDELTSERKAFAILDKIKTSPAYTQMRAERDEAEKPICAEIDHLQKERGLILQKQDAIIDRKVNQMLRKAGITTFFCREGYLREITHRTPENWQYGRTAIYGEQPGFSR